MLIAIAICCIILVLIAVVLWNSPGILPAFTDGHGVVIPNSISEKGYIEINGSRLGFIIKGKNLDNPILLYLHGGMPDYFLTQDHPTGLEDVFTVVWWDQRGAGLSSGAKFGRNTGALETMLSDTKEVANYLRKRFSKDKIFLMAHSGGTYLGIKAIERFPELFIAYIGVAQISNQKLSEMKAYDYIFEQYSKDNSKSKIVELLRKSRFSMSDPIPLDYLKIRDKAMHDLGVGTMRKMADVVSGVFIPSLLFKEYSVSEKIGLWKAKANSGISMIWDDILSHDLSKESTTFSIPVYFLEGIYDYTCSYELAHEYFSKINAPKKEFITFKNSAHSPIFEEPEESIRVMKEKVLGDVAF